MSSSDVLFNLMAERHLTAKEVAIATGISSGNFSDWKKGRSKPSYNALVKLATYFNVPIECFNGGINEIAHKPKYSDEALEIAVWWDRLDRISQAIIKGDILRRLEDGGISPGQHAAAIPYKNTVADSDTSCDNTVMLNLPVMGRSAAGMPIEMVSIPNEPITINGEAQVKVGDFIVIAVGDSMIEAGIHDGDQCVIRPQDQVENGEIALIAVDDGSTIKRFYQDDQGIHLKPCNPAHPTQHYDVDAPIRVLGRFITVVK